MAACAIAARHGVVHRNPAMAHRSISHGTDAAVMGRSAVHGVALQGAALSADPAVAAGEHFAARPEYIDTPVDNAADQCPSNPVTANPCDRASSCLRCDVGAVATWLAPTLVECLVTEVASLHINAELLADCLSAVRALRSFDSWPDHAIRCVGDGVRDALNATVGDAKPAQCTDDSTHAAPPRSS